MRVELNNQLSLIFEVGVTSVNTKKTKIGHFHCVSEDSGPICVYGESGHKAKTYALNKCCVLFNDRDMLKEDLTYVPDSGRCQVFHILQVNMLRSATAYNLTGQMIQER